MRCGTCGGFFHQSCPHWPQCQPVDEAPQFPPRDLLPQDYSWRWYVVVAIIVGTFFAGAIWGKLRAEGVLEGARCAALAAYWEARGEGPEGMRAVAHVAYNRAAARNQPVCAVVNSTGWNGASWLEQVKKPITDRGSWEMAQTMALVALQDPDGDPTLGATHFHRLDVTPGWSGEVSVVKIGAHLFMALRP